MKVSQSAQAGHSRKLLLLMDDHDDVMSLNSSTSSDTFYEWTSCARTLPFTHFPGIKRAVRLENGIRVHFPVVPEVSTTTTPPSTFRPLAASTPTIVVKEENLRQLQQQAGTDEDAAKSGSALGDNLAFVHQVHDEILLTEIPEANNNHLVIVMRTRSAGTLRASAAAGLVTPEVSAGRLTANIKPDDETARDVRTLLMTTNLIACKFNGPFSILS